MADLSPGSHANLILDPDDVLRVTASGQATVEALYGAPAGTTLLTAQTQDFGPYGVPSKLRVTASSGRTSYGALGVDEAEAGSPVQASGTRGVGSVLSAVLGIGWSVSGYQWVRVTNGVAADIGGATGATYTQQSADVAPGVGVRVRVSGLSFTRDALAAAATVSVPTPTVLTITSTIPTTATVGTAYSGSVAASGGTLPYTYSVFAGALPAGLSLNASTGAVTGTPTAATTATGLVFRVTDSLGATANTAAQSITVAAAGVAPTITVQPQAATVASGATATFSVTATGTAPVTYQWRLGAATIVGATSASYTTPALSAGDTGGVYSVVVANAHGSVTSSGATLTVTSGAAYPVPAGIKLAVFGDSRTSSNEEQSGSSLADRQPATGYAYWLCSALGYAVDLVGVYGVNTDTIDGLNTRLTAAGIAKQTDGSTTPLIGTVPPSRGFVTNGTYSPAVSGAAPANGPIHIAVVLIGVNNTTESISTVAGKYQTLLDALDAQGWAIVLCNEIPSNRNDGGMQPHLDRRTWLDAATLTSGHAMLHVNTWDAVKHPTNPNMCADNLYNSHVNGTYDGQLHANTAGNKILGETIASAMQPMLTAAGFTARGAAATTATSLLQYAAMTGTAGTVTAGTNLNGSGATLVSGTMPDGWTIDLTSMVSTLNTGGLQDGTNGNLTVALSQYTDGDGYGHVVVTGAGRIGSSTSGISTLTISRTVFKSAASLTNIENGIGVVDGDSLYGTAVISVPAATVGLLGAAVLGQASSPAYNAYSTGGVGTKASGTGNWSGLSAPLATWANLPAVTAKRVVTSGRKLPAGYSSTVETKTLSAQVQIAVQQGVTGSWQIDVSHLGLTKNIGLMLAGALMLGNDLLALGSDMIGLI